MKPFLTINDLLLTELAGRRILVRVDFNVPMADGRVVDDFRLQKNLPLIDQLVKAGARVILLSHLGDQPSFEPVIKWFKPYQPITFYENIPKVDDLNLLPNGSVVLLNNLRLAKGEEENSEEFAKQLAGLGEIYINNAFSVSHRTHASIVALPKLLPAYAGPLFETEFTELTKLITPALPMLLILGGAKFDTKVPLLKKYLPLADQIFVVGALAHGFLKKRNLPIGQSLLEAEELFAEFADNDKIILPLDMVVESDGQKIYKKIENVSPTDIIYDAGPETIKLIGEALTKAKTILWNGPLGNFEKGFNEGTIALAKLIAKAEGYSVIGGGDTLAVIQALNLESEFGFVSTAGGAMLDFLATGTLPGIEALTDANFKTV